MQYAIFGKKQFSFIDTELEIAEILTGSCGTSFYFSQRL
jgi:hypothetical protein